MADETDDWWENFAQFMQRNGVRMSGIGGGMTDPDTGITIHDMGGPLGGGIVNKRPTGVSLTTVPPKKGRVLEGEIMPKEYQKADYGGGIYDEMGMSAKEMEGDVHQLPFSNAEISNLRSKIKYYEGRLKDPNISDMSKKFVQDTLRDDYRFLDEELARRGGGFQSGTVAPEIAASAIDVQSQLSKSTKPRGILSELDARTGGTEPNPVRFGREEPVPETGFFMGPWATPEDVPGMTLASRPQNIRRGAHYTKSKAAFNEPKMESAGDEALHITTDPDLGDQYAGLQYFDQFGENPVLTNISNEMKPRAFPMLFNPGPNPIDIGNLVPGLYPWKKDVGGSVRSVLGEGDPTSNRTSFTDILDDPMFDTANREGNFNDDYVRAINARTRGDTFEDYMRDEGASSMWYFHEPTGVSGLPHESYALIDPGSKVNALSPEGILASRWNKVQPMNPSNVTPEMQTDWDLMRSYADFTNDSGIRARLRRLGYTDKDIEGSFDRQGVDMQEVLNAEAGASYVPTGSVASQAITQAASNPAASLKQTLGSMYDNMSLKELKADLREAKADFKKFKDKKALGAIHDEINKLRDAIQKRSVK